MSGSVITFGGQISLDWLMVCKLYFNRNFIKFMNYFLIVYLSVPEFNFARMFLDQANWLSSRYQAGHNVLYVCFKSSF